MKRLPTRKSARRVLSMRMVNELRKWQIKYQASEDYTEYSKLALQWNISLPV
jgi:hypothetical protein